jgi:hypothetical protein
VRNNCNVPDLHIIPLLLAGMIPVFGRAKVVIFSRKTKGSLPGNERTETIICKFVNQTLT